MRQSLLILALALGVTGAAATAGKREPKVVKIPARKEKTRKLTEDHLRVVDHLKTALVREH